MKDVTVTIRDARPADLAAVLALERATAGAPHWALRHYESILQPSPPGSPVRCLLLAERSQRDERPARTAELIGFSVAMVIPHAGADPATQDVWTRPAAELESVVVSAAFRRAGIGRALCLRAFEWCRSAGARSVELEVRAGGAAALSLYRTLGFNEAGRRPRYYSDPEEDALLLRLPLDGN